MAECRRHPDERPSELPWFDTRDWPVGGAGHGAPGTPRWRTRTLEADMRTGSIGASILLIAVGAVMAYAVTVDTEGFNINTAGVILMVVGAIGLIVSMIMLLVNNGRADRVDHVETRYVERERM
jgi:hypothetical protein